MLRFLSKFGLATRIYAGFLFLGAYAVAVCFGAMAAVGFVHREYVKADNVIEATRQVSALETYLFSLNRALFLFASDGTDIEKQAAEEAFSAFEEKAAEVENVLELPDVREKYKSVLSAAMEKYKSDMAEMFSLHDKSAKTAEKVNQYAEKASVRLNALIEETTLPSASFALNALREQLDAVLQSVDNVSAENAESRKRLTADFAALKKAQNAAKQAEMINTKQLKNVIAAISGLDEEINRKLKIDTALREKMRAVSAVGDGNSKDFKELVALMGRACAQTLSQAEAGKISMQKIFVFAAAFGGFLAVALSFLSLFGIRYPLARLISSAQEMARGDRSVLIHFTEREDEVGTLAKALAALLVRLKSVPVLTNEMLGRKNAVSTFGSSVAYVPLGAPSGTAVSAPAAQSSDGDEIAYFGQGVGVDTESQLCQMLALMQHIGNSAAAMTKEVKDRFAACREHLFTLSDRLQNVDSDAADAAGKMAREVVDGLREKVDAVSAALADCFAPVDEMREMLKKQSDAADAAADRMQRMAVFAAGLTNWVKAAGDLTDAVRSSAAETKILALNASIEAAKAGEKAKAFGAVSLDMRHRTHKTAEAADQLSVRLTEVRQETMRFIEVMQGAVSDVDAFRRAMQAAAAAQDRQNGHLQTVSGLSETAKEAVADFIADSDFVRDFMTNLPDRVKKTEELPPLLETQIAQAEQQLDAFNSCLPTYEDDTDADAE